MAKKLIFLPVIVLSLLIISIESQANVIVEDADSATQVTAALAFTSASVLTGSGQVGDYQIIACGVTTDSGNTFSDPVPGTWEELDTGPCSGNGVCIHGISGRFIDNPASENITCNWALPSVVFAAGSFRYSEVDPIDPIIAIECNSGAADGGNIMATAPSVITVAGSQVVRIYTYRNFDFEGTMDSNFNSDVEGSFISIATLGDVATVSQQGDTELVLVDGPTGEASIDAGSNAQWRACTIALRMAPEPRNVPTMSEWGLIAFAAFAGIAGIWYLRRRRVTA